MGSLSIADNQATALELYDEYAFLTIPRGAPIRLLLTAKVKGMTAVICSQFCIKSFPFSQSEHLNAQKEFHDAKVSKSLDKHNVSCWKKIFTPSLYGIHCSLTFF